MPTLVDERKEKPDGQLTTIDGREDPAVIAAKHTVYYFAYGSASDQTWPG